MNNSANFKKMMSSVILIGVSLLLLALGFYHLYNHNRYVKDGDKVPAIVENTFHANIVGKWKSFGFNTLFIDGHDFEALDSAIQCAKNTKGQPTAIILDTVKGKGAKFVEDAKTGNHSMAVTKQDVENFLKEVGE